MEFTGPPISPSHGTPAVDAVPPAPAPAARQGPSFATVLRAVGQRIDEGQRLMERVESARTSLDATELLVLQARVYRYTEAVELASKLVDRTSNAIKTTLQSQ